MAVLVMGGLVMVTASNVQAQDPDLPNPQAHIELIPSGSLIISMDHAVQNEGDDEFNQAAYGLVVHLLHAEIPVKWAITAGKVKDGVDFSVNASKIRPSSGTPSNKSFKGGPFIVHADHAADALTIIDAFRTNSTVLSQNGDAAFVVVFQTNVNKNIDIRYTLYHKPFVGVLNNGGNEDKHIDVLLEAGLIEGIHFTHQNETDTDDLLIQNFTAESCYTIATEAHTDESKIGIPEVSGVKAWLNSGGNFLAQCHAVQSYETEEFEAGVTGQLLTTTGLEVTNSGDGPFGFPNADLPYSQLTGDIEDQGGAGQDWVPLTTTQNNAHAHAVGDDGTMRAWAGKLHPGTNGSNVFYLGGHEHKGDDLLSINNRRMYMNAILIPVERPSECSFSFEPDTPSDDFGDAPDSYGTLLASNGPKHTISDGLYLGSCVDGDADGINSANSDGDDVEPGSTTSGTCSIGNDDEDGVTFPVSNPPLTAGLQTCINVMASAPGKLDAWIDFHADGSFNPVDQVFANRPLNAGNNNLCFTPPDNMVPETTFSRFRFSSTGGLTPKGGASDGEVEDYMVSFPLPVELSNFGALVEDSRIVRLDWTTASESNNQGFEVQHIALPQSTDWQSLAFVEGAGSSTEMRNYSYRVEGLEPGLHWFRLKQIDWNGGHRFSNVVETKVEVPGHYMFMAAYPNPFSQSTMLRFSVKVEQEVAVRLFDVHGRQLQTVYDGRPEPGRMHEVSVDADGLSSGIYILSLEGETFRTFQKIMLIQ